MHKILLTTAISMWLISINTIITANTKVNSSSNPVYLAAPSPPPAIEGGVSYFTYKEPQNNPISPSYEVGTSKGMINVGGMGDAQYSIPINLPAGPGGLTPSISINYSSNGGVGTCGYGWNISGLSSVSRTGLRYYYDNVPIEGARPGMTLTLESAHSGVNLNALDRLSLNGQRLICLDGISEYNNNGSVYRTELDNFTKLTCSANSNGPNSFVANLKNGTKMYYGGGYSSQKITGYNETLRWFVNKTEDVYGNEINYEYQTDNCFNYISKISYGVNEVSFYYKERIDIKKVFFKGVEMQQRLVLDRIEIKYNNTLIRKYQFRYAYPTSSFQRYSVLNEVLEYGINGKRYNSTLFGYNTPDSWSFNGGGSGSSYGYISSKSEITTGDFNGDGQTDLFCRPANGASWSGYKVYFSDGDNSFSLAFEDTSNYFGFAKNIMALDINADGKDDLVYDNKNHFEFSYKYVISNGTSFNYPVKFYTITNPLAIPSLDLEDSFHIADDHTFKGADYNGDGINDIFVVNGIGQWKIYSFGSEGNLTSTLTQMSSGANPSFTQKNASKDFNGDGKTDYWNLTSSELEIYDGGAKIKTFHSSIVNENHHLSLGDFNGDGKTDILVYGLGFSSWSTWKIHLSTGTGFKTYSIYQKESSLKDKIVKTIDIDGDGRTELMVSSKRNNYYSNKIYFAIKDGTDFSSSMSAGGYYDNESISVGDFTGNGYMQVLRAGYSYTIRNANGVNNYALKNVRNGLGHNTSVTYKRLSELGAHYTKGNGASFPMNDYQGNLMVVDKVELENGIGGTTTQEYTYEGAKLHLQGKGIVCFEHIKTKNIEADQSSIQNYTFHPTHYYGQLTSSESKTGETTTSTVVNTWNEKATEGDVFFPYVASSIISNNLTGHSRNVTNTYDNYGNVTKNTVKFSNSVTTTTQTTYSNNTSTWILGLPISTTVTHSESGQTSISKTTSFTYASDGIIKPDYVKVFEGTNYYNYVNNDYDSYGNILKVSKGGSGVSIQNTSFTYESNGIRQKTTTNSLGHVSTNNYDTYGRLSSQIDYLNNSINYAYDNLHRNTSTTKSDGSAISQSITWGVNGGPSHAVYYTQQTGNDGSLSKTWHDKLGRVIRTDVRNFDGSFIYIASEYNSQGQTSRVSEPSASTSPSQWNVNTYDSYGRIDLISHFNGRQTDYAYSNNQISVTTDGKTTWQETDSRGLVTTAHDNGGDLVYNYYPNGLVKTITAPGGVVTTFEYDAAWNRSKMVDPSAGTTTHTYDAFGRVKTEKNARNQTTTINYHADGRLNTKISPEGTTTYNYNSNKQLSGVSSPDNINRTYTYNTKGRVNSIRETIAGTIYSTSFTYDTKGRLSGITHPTGIVETNNYNTNGYLSSVSTGGTVQYTINAMNARQQITSASYANGLVQQYAYDAYGLPTSIKAQSGSTWKQDMRFAFNEVNGNLNTRENYLKSKTESFTYDNMDRLTNVNGPQNLSMNYATNGNITNKSDIGIDAFSYDNSAKPYMLTGISSSTNIIPDEEQYVSYTSFNQVSNIDQGDYHASLLYNNDGQRCKMEVKEQNNTILTRIYVGGRYIKETANGTTKEYTWIGGDAYSAPLVAIKQGSSISYYKLLRDHLGSITKVLNSSNVVIYEYSFDAWGRRRDKDTWQYNLSGEPELFAGRGFTAHEELPWFDLVNMNGRLYDPVVGRFLSADPIIQSPTNTQNYNRYSYCLNNPLKFTDPSGYQAEKIRQNHDDFIDETENNGGLGWKNHDFMFGGGSGGWSSNSPINGPGFGGNGPGLGGIYYDWSSGTYRSTTNINQEIDWRDAYNIASNYGVNYTFKHAYVTVGSYRYYKGSSKHLSREPLVEPVVMGITNGVEEDGSFTKLNHWANALYRMHRNMPADAYSLSGNFDLVIPWGGVDGTPYGRLKIINGKDAGALVNFEDYGYAYGWDWGASGVLTAYYYVGNVSNLRMNHFKGDRYSASVGYSFGFEVGGGYMVAPLANGDYIIGKMIHLGISPTGPSGNFNDGATLFY